MRWCLYALGGGLGHLTRELALARAAIARGHDVTVLTNSPYSERVPVADELGFPQRLVKLSPHLDHQQVAQAVDERLANSSFDLLVVDTFPRGLAGELSGLLPKLSAKKVLIHRDLNPRYVAWAKLEQVARQYDLVLSPGELGPLADLPNVRRTSPWLMRDPHELLDQATAWQRLRITEPSLPVIAVIASGISAEQQPIHDLSGRLTLAWKSRASVRWISLDAVARTDPSIEAVSLWPCLSAMRGIDLLIGAGGYNTVWEARATQTPLIAIARPRLYDRQDVRLKPIERAGNELEAEQRAHQWLDQFRGHRRASVPNYANGVHDAIRWIESL